MENIYDFNKLMQTYMNMFDISTSPYNIFKNTDPVYVDTTKKHLGNNIYLVYYTEEDKNEFCFRLENYKNPKSKKIFYNNDNYGYLMKDGIKLSDVTFRVGGIGGKYKDGYCQLIQYNDKTGKQCLVDINGEIILIESNYGHNLYHKGGIIATMNDYIYNLLNKKIIVKGKIVTTSKDYIFVENNYDFKKEYPEGVYKININTGESEFYAK